VLPAAFRFGRRYMRGVVGRKNAPRGLRRTKAAQWQGFAIVHWEHRRGGVRAYLETLEVRRFAEQGTGGELLRRCEDSARAAGAEVLELHVDAENGRRSDCIELMDLSDKEEWRLLSRGARGRGVCKAAQGDQAGWY